MIVVTWGIRKEVANSGFDWYIAEEVRCGQDGIGCRVDELTGQSVTGPLIGLRNVLRENGWHKTSIVTAKYFEIWDKV
jgi:hypothetical protein